MSRLPPIPDIQWKTDGTPLSTSHGDVYFSATDGLAETEAVFLNACDLPKAWMGRSHYTIGELGFGTGLNFLATWRLWERHRPHSSAQLHFVSFEGYPMALADTRQVHARWPVLTPYSEKLLSRWPTHAMGVQTLTWPTAGIRLVLHIGPVAHTLPESVLKADAWFLDGFSPAKNSSMWDEALYPLIAERSAPGAKIGTYTVAGRVRRGLAAAGFAVAKAPGFGRKRERLIAHYAGPPAQAPDPFALRPPIVPPERVAVIGGGIAGANLAHALTRRGAMVTLYEQANHLGAGASGNPLALVMPRLDAGDTGPARLLIDAYIAAQSTYRGLPGALACPVRQTPKDPTDAARLEKIAADPPLPVADLDRLPGGVLLHKTALLVHPHKLLKALTDGAEVKCGEEGKVDPKKRTVNGTPYDAIILANGMAVTATLPDLAWLTLTARQGQVDYVRDASPVPAMGFAAGHYALADGGLRLTGATFTPADGAVPAPPTSSAQAENLAALQSLSPWIAEDFKAANIHARTGIRATTPDRLPVAGAIPDITGCLNLFAGKRHGQPALADAPRIEGLYLMTGLGSRGFLFAPWLAALLTAQLFADAAPATRTALEAISPMRFLFRQLKRGQL